MKSYKVWDDLAVKYNKLWVQKYSLSPTRNKVLKTLNKYFSKSQNFKILDIGSGTGQLGKKIVDTFINAKYEGIDVSCKMVEQAQKIYHERLSFLCVEIDDFVTINKYDVIIITHAFPYFPNKAKVLEMAYNLLSENGILIISNASCNNIYDKIALFFVKFTTSKANYLSICDINKLLKKQNFKIIESSIIKERFYMPTICYFVAKKA